jgi:hypothetical protein
MAIDSSGKWWRGEDAADLAEYLRAYAAGGIPADQVISAVCSRCAGTVFRLCVDGEEGGAERTCVACGQAVRMLDSEDHWDDLDLQPVICPCGSDRMEVAAGFALRADREVRWVSVGFRCAQDGTLGCGADWKIDYGPSSHLLGGV